MHHTFNNFDPLDIPLPQHHRDDFWDVVFNARHLLKDRSREELIQGMEVLQDITHRRDLANPRAELIKSWAPVDYPLPDGTVCEAMPAPDDVDMLLLNRERINLAEYGQFPGAQWHELFALLALSYVVQAHITEAHHQDPSRKGTPFEVNEAFMERLHRECLEVGRRAIHVGQGMKVKTEEIQRKQSSKGRNAVTAKHEQQTGALKRRVAELYWEHYSNESNRQAAKMIFEWLTVVGELKADRKGETYSFQGKQVMSNDDPEHQLERWIAKIKASGPAQ